MNTASDGHSLALTTDTSAQACSPITEFYNSAANNDWLFVGLPANCAFGGASIGCVMSFNVAGTYPTTFPTSAVATGAESSGTSGIVVDNASSDAQASSLYFSTLGTAPCDAGGNATACAVKRTQTGLQ